MDNINDAILLVIIVMQLHVTTFVGISLALKLFQDLDHVPHHVMF
jgi:hypothetical protein